MNDPAIYLSLESGLIGYLLIPLLALFALDGIGRLAAFGLFSIGNPSDDTWLNRILIKRRFLRSGLRNQLRLRGIAPETYLDSQLLVQLDNQLNTCQQCDSNAACTNSHRSSSRVPPLTQCPNGAIIWPLLER